jgi:hypothetical protein
MVADTGRIWRGAVVPFGLPVDLLHHHPGPPPFAQWARGADCTEGHWFSVVEVVVEVEVDRDGLAAAMQT